MRNTIKLSAVLGIFLLGLIGTSTASFAAQGFSPHLQPVSGIIQVATPFQEPMPADFDQPILDMPRLHPSSFCLSYQSNNESLLVPQWPPAVVGSVEDGFSSVLPKYANAVAVVSCVA